MTFGFWRTKRRDLVTSTIGGSLTRYKVAATSAEVVAGILCAGSCKIKSWFISCRPQAAVLGMYLQGLGPCLAHGRYSVNTIERTEWITLTINEKTENSENRVPKTILTIGGGKTPRSCAILNRKFCPLHHIPPPPSPVVFWFCVPRLLCLKGTTF